MQKTSRRRATLMKFGDVLYDAEDLVDELSIEASWQQRKLQNNLVNKVLNFFTTLPFYIAMPFRSKKIRERLNDIAVDRISFHFMQPPVGLHDRNKERKQTHSSVIPTEVVGRDGDKRAIIKLLKESSIQENVSVIPIVGIGGVGRTTLAKLVFHDEGVDHFQLKLWVCVSDNFDLKVIAKNILESVTKTETGNLEMETLLYHLQEKIDKKKYLLVLDDVWNENPRTWHDLKCLLMGGAPGSKIIVTTRSKRVAEITRTTSPYYLRGLSNNESWCLFKRMAFQQGQVPENSDLVAIGKEIVGKCTGVPLAIRTIGSLLCFKTTATYWLYFKDNELSKIAQTENNDIFPILKLSYDNLLPHLKHCFAYCALYPKNYQINVQTLINLWMAQGFINSPDENLCLEDVGYDHFIDLLQRFFFQEAQMDEWGNVISCKMHDLMHDLAQVVAGIRCTMATLDAKNIDERTRHVSFDSNLDSSWEIPSPLLRADNIRTLLLPVQSSSDGKLKGLIHDTLVSSFSHLRVLDLHNLGVETVPHSIGELKQLRYLDLSRNKGIKVLPSSITRLQNLQTLNVSACEGLKELPTDICNLVSLRHLDINGCSGLTHIPPGLGQLTSLQTLTRFVVGRVHTIFQRGGGLSELSGLNNLRGELKIEILGHTRIATSQFKEANLTEKQYLQTLKIEWNERGVGFDEMLLEGLQPHPNLKELHVKGYGGQRFSSWFSRYTNLVKVYIQNCGGCEYLPPLHQLPSLKILSLDNLVALEYIDIGGKEFSSSAAVAFFPSLKELTLSKLPNLSAWWRRTPSATTTMVEDQDQLEHQQHRLLLISFPCLSKLKIKHCPELIFMPLFLLLKEELYLKYINERLLQHQSMMMMKLMTEAAESSTSSSSSLSLSSPSSSSSFSPYSSLFKLKSLCIRGTGGLKSLPEEWLQNLTSLEHLEIGECPHLMSLPGDCFRGLTSLRSLNIYICDELTSFPQGMQYLTALEVLDIGDCHKLDLSTDNGIHWQSLRNLRSLTINDFPQLVSLPRWIQRIATLQDLWILYCPKLTVLPEWIANLMSLQDLRICDCPSLMSLPEGTSRLTSLQNLTIHNSPNLYKTCQKEKGVDWHKIAHIPEINITRK